MKTFKLFFASVAIAALLIGCKEDPSITDPLLGFDGEYLISESYKNGALSAKFEYNDKNQLVSMEGYASDGTLISTGVYAYNDKGQPISFAIETAGALVTTKLLYDNKGRISESLSYDGDELVVSNSHTYEENKIIVTGLVDNEVSTMNTYILDGKNIIREEFILMGQPQFNWVREWSDFDEMKQARGSYFSRAYLQGANNPRRETMTSVHPDLNFDWRWEYTYNETGYMTSATSFDANTGQKLDTYDYHLIKAK